MGPSPDQRSQRVCRASDTVISVYKRGRLSPRAQELAWSSTMSELNRAGGSAVAVEAGRGATSMKRVAAACLVGSTVELYDFQAYSTAAALVFPTVFFPHLSPAMAAI